MNNNDNNDWNPWKGPRQRMTESNLVRYGVAALLPMIATLLIWIRPPLMEAPFFVFLGAVVLSALYNGLAPAFATTALSSVLLRLFFVSHDNDSLHYGTDFAGMERMGFFVLVSMALSCFVASLRRQMSQFRDTEERYRILAETASDAIIVIDEHGEILYVNAMAEGTFGARAEELLGKNLTHLLPGGDYQAQLSEMKQRLDTRRKPVAVQMPGLRHCGKPLLVEMTLGTSSHRGKDVFTAIIRDLTEIPRS